MVGYLLEIEMMHLLIGLDLMDRGIHMGIYTTLKEQNRAPLFSVESSKRQTT